jgi:hypothetical protein
MPNPQKKDEVGLDLDQVMLDAARERGMEKLQGELEEAATGDEPAASESAESKAEETVSPKSEEEKKEETAQKTETSEGEPGTQEPKETKPEEKKYLFKTLDEFEKHYKNLQRTLQKKDDEIRAREERIRQFEAEKELQEKIQEADKSYREFLTERMKQTTDAIDELDPDEEGYDERVAQLRAEELADIRAYERQHPEIFGPISIKPATTEEPPSAEPAGTAEGGIPEVPETVEEAFQIRDRIAKESEIDPEDPVFLGMCSKAPSTDEAGKPISFRDQVKWAIDQTKNYHASYIEKFKKDQIKAAEETALRRQEEELPLGSTGGGHETAKKPGSEAKPEPKVVTLNDAIENVLAERTL